MSITTVISGGGVTVLGVGASGAWADFIRSPQTFDVSADAPTAVAGVSIPPSLAPSLVTTPLADTSVSLSNGISAFESVYARPEPVEQELAWATAPEDELSQLMQGNIKKQPLVLLNSTSLLNGLGAKLLGRFSTTQSDFSQTVVSYESKYRNPTVDGTSINYSATDVTRTSAAEALKNAAGATNRIGFRIQTLSGKTVDISISYGGNGKEIKGSLSVGIHVSGGELSEAEKTAVAKLSSGFESLLQSVSQGTGDVDFSGLLGYDATVLSGVDLTVRQTPQFGSELKSLDFHANSKQRSFALETTKGSLSLSVDLTQSAVLGSSAQQHAAVQNYLAQFDAANQRGHGDSRLLGQFKDAFAALHSNYPVSGGSTAPAILPALNDKDRSVLTGLADFEASISGDFDRGNEVGHLDYRVAQSTQIVGENKLNGLSVSQTQTSRLKASFLRSPDGSPLNTASGNYESISIDDETSSTTSFAYENYELQMAKTKQVSNQLELFKKFVNHQVVEERNTPLQKIDEQDISTRLLPPKKQ